MIYVGKLAEGKSLEDVNDKFKEHKDLYFTKFADDEALFFMIKRVPYPFSPSYLSA